MNHLMPGMVLSRSGLETDLQLAVDICPQDITTMKQALTAPYHHLGQDSVMLFSFGLGQECAHTRREERQVYLKERAATCPWCSRRSGKSRKNLAVHL